MSDPKDDQLTQGKPAELRHSTVWNEELDSDPFRRRPSAEVAKASPSLSTVLNKLAGMIRQEQIPLATNEEWNAGAIKAFHQLEEASRTLDGGQFKARL